MQEHLLTSFSLHRNAMILNCLLASLYVLLGSFRYLLTFKGNCVAYNKPIFLRSVSL
jgi:hypothetical protein